MAEEVVEITGTVQRLNCQKPTFCAGRISGANGGSISFSVKGYCKVGDAVTLSGVWEHDPKWGRQFKAKSLTLSMPTDPAGLVKWLHWNCTGVGAITAQRLVDEFGVELMSKCASDPEAVAIHGKMKIEEVAAMAEQWRKEGARVNALTWLAGLGLTQRQCEAILTRFGGGATELVRDDPYQLIGRAEGFGWLTTDALAAKLDIVGEDPRRLRGAVAAVVRETYDGGSTCVAQAHACQRAADKLGVRDPNLIAEAVEAAVEKGDVVRFGRADVPYLATKFAIDCERVSWLAFERSRDPNPHLRSADPGAVAEGYRQMAGITFDDSQVAAIANALMYRISVVTGGAGSGKTQVSKAIVKMFEDDDVPVYLCAPTGKAARRMTELIGRPASTIHRLLEFNGGTGLFGRNREEPLDNCVILVDEVSMVDAEMFARVILALGPRAALVCVGDPNQLPPVGPGSVLRDVLTHDLVPTVRLEKVHRQAGPLKANSMAILAGRIEPTVVDHDGPASPWMVSAVVTTGEAVAKVVTAMYERHLREWGYDPIRQTQFMTAKHDGPFGTKRLNLILQHLHQTALGNPIPEPSFDAHESGAALHVGDKVIQTKNNYEINVMNGEVGIVLAVNPNRDVVLQMLGYATAARPASEPLAGISDTDPGVVAALARRAEADRPVADFVVDFHDRIVVFPVTHGGDLQLAYCLSVHKMQGSQVDCAVLFVPKLHAFMQNRSWLYTGATRASRTLVLAGDTDGLRRAADKVVVDERQTVLRVFATTPEARP